MIVDDWGSWDPHHFNAECVNIFACFGWILPHRFQCAMGFAAQEPWTSTTTTWAQLYGLRLTGPPNHTPPWCNHQRCNWHQSSTAVFLVYLGIDIYDNEITCGDMMIWQKHMSSHPCFIPSNCTLHPKLPWLWLCHWCQPGVSNASSPKAWGLMLASPSIFHLKNMSIRKKKRSI